MNPRIRPYRESDETAVAALWRAVFPGAPEWNRPEQDIRRKCMVQPHLFLVAAVGARIVGTAMAGFDGHRGWVYYVTVAPDTRRRGIGAALMGRVERDLVQAGCTKLNLQVRPGNEAAVAFYRHLGYQVEPRVSMGKRLREESPGRPPPTPRN